MSYSSDLTRQRIIKSAEKEFLKHGFQKANVRRIAQKAKVTTSTLYNHFGGKENLFKTLVEETAEEYFSLLQKEHGKCSDLDGLLLEKQTVGRSNVSFELLLNFIYKHFTAFKLIICCSEGTSYAKYIDRIIQLEETTNHRLLQKIVSNREDLDVFFIHTISAMGVKNMLEIIEHDLPKEKALAYVEKVKDFHLAGWLDMIKKLRLPQDKTTVL